MAIEVKVPAVGESITEGRIAKWLKPDGAAVAMDEPIFELETDKATQDIPAPAAGVISIKVKEGDVVKIGTVVAAIDPNGKATASGGRKAPVELPETSQVQQGTDAPRSTKVSPAARQIAAEVNNAMSAEVTSISSANEPKGARMRKMVMAGSRANLYIVKIHYGRGRESSRKIFTVSK